MVRDFPKIDRHRRRVLEPALISDNTGPRNTLLPEHALVISLARSGRIEAFNRTNNFNGITEAIDAVDGKLIQEPLKVPSMNYGALGCLRSHRIALEYAKLKGWEMVLILEDDAQPVEGFNEKLADAMRELPEDFDMLWLGGNNNTPPAPYSPLLKQLTGSWGTYGMVIRNTVYDFFIEQFKEEYQSSDEYYRRYHLKFKSFRTSVDLVNHTGDVSEIMKVNYQRATQ